jgi:hypothetical protein
LYANYDAQLSAYTRFFAAAAAVNALLAKLYLVIRSPCSFAFLTEVGAVLETHNRALVRAISGSACGRDLDEALVCAEQEHLQAFVTSQQARRPQQWAAARSEINGFLNERCAVLFFCRCWARSGSFSQVLRAVRDHLGGDIDFAMESHRISVGLKLIECIRGENAPAVRLVNRFSALSCAGGIFGSAGAKNPGVQTAP